MGSQFGTISPAISSIQFGQDFLVEQVAAFIPLPFAHDPLLLKWFDDHAEIWQTMRSMQAVKAAKAVQHGVTDRKRTE